MKVLGLDVSTAVTGYTILDDSMNIVCMGHIDFSKCKNLWEKADLAKTKLKELLALHSIDKVFVEESLLGFTSGASSATTIMTLSKFNALVSYFVREISGFDPEFIAANSARKTVGIRLIQKKKCGLSHKEQAFLWCTGPQGPLKDLQFPKTKTGKFKPFVSDQVDSYVIARAGVVLNKPV